MTDPDDLSEVEKGRTVALPAQTGCPLVSRHSRAPGVDVFAAQEGGGGLLRFVATACSHAATNSTVARDPLRPAVLAGDPGSSIELLLRLACGERVTQADALRVLHNSHAIDDFSRHERIARVKARDAALVDAACVLGADDPGAWRVAVRLASAVKRFEAVAWIRLRAGLQCELSPVDAALHRAFLTGLRVPRTPRGLYELLK